MSLLPPPPPPPPQPLVKEPQEPTTHESPGSNLDPTIYTWASNEPHLWDACAKHNICPDSEPFKWNYKHFDSILQVGPTCGLVALSMIVNAQITVDTILNISKEEGYTSNGEMFSCKNMLKLAGKIFGLLDRDGTSYDLRTGGLFSNEIIERLINGAVLLVPYDADCNHSPCCRKGHTAHWALICGVIITENQVDFTSNPENVYVLAKHGKSRHLAVWRLDKLEQSNGNLKEFSPKKSSDGLVYVMPDGGMGGRDGLKNQFILIEGL